jgi:DUF1680 family protein
LDKVKLQDPDFVCRRDLAKRYISDFDVGRLMHTFRVNAGISSGAEPLSGWEAPDCGLRGHFVGHFLSACSKFAFAEKDEYLKSKAYEIVDILETCAKPNGYLSAFEEEKLDVLEFEEDRGAWAPYYTLHKILQGLIDCYIYLNNTKALLYAKNIAYYIQGRFAKLSQWKIDGLLRCTKVNPQNEFGGIGDALYSLYEITRDIENLRLAHVFDRGYFIDPLAFGKDVLENLHANTHLPMIIAAMHRYNIGGESKYQTAAVNFYEYLLGRTFANGNSSSKATAFIKDAVSEKSEHWGKCDDLSDALTGGESESCCAHNTERILQQLLGWTGSVEFLDHLETLKYNAVLNSCSQESGLSQYHQPMGTGVTKKFSGLTDTFWCCTGSGIEAMSELQKNIWFKDQDTILLNAFISSTVEWKEIGAVISQFSDFPDSETSTLVIHLQKPAEFKLMLKEASVKTVKLNSQEIAITKENGFIIIRRVFKDNDQIEIEISASLSLVPLKGCDDMAAVLYGRILLAQLGEPTRLDGVTHENVGNKFTRTTDAQLAFSADAGPGRVKFIPLYRVENENYSVYLSRK